jgi:hypothetical protein
MVDVVATVVATIVDRQELRILLDFYLLRAEHGFVDLGPMP